MNGRRLAILGFLLGASACANVLGLDFVDTEPTPSTADGGGSGAHATDATVPNADGPSGKDGSSAPLDSSVDTLDSSPNGDSSEDDGPSTRGDAGVGSTSCPVDFADASFAVTFPLNPLLSGCVTQVGDVRSASSAVDVYAIADAGAAADGSVPFSGFVLNLPSAYFDRAQGRACTMHVRLDDEAKSGTIGFVTTPSSVDMTTLKVFLGGDGGSDILVQEELGNEQVLLSGWMEGQYYDVGFQLGPGASQNLDGEGYVPGAMGFPPTTIVAPPGTNVLIHLGISGLSGASATPALRITSITCGSPL